MVAHIEAARAYLRTFYRGAVRGVAYDQGGTLPAGRMNLLSEPEPVLTRAQWEKLTDTES